MSVEVRLAGIDESHAIVPLYEWLFAPPGSRPPDWQPDLAVERLREAIAANGSTVLVAVEADRFVGLCTAYIDLVSVRFGVRCWVEDLAVDPSRRSEGIGRALLAAALTWAGANGASHLELDSGDDRAGAHRFYEREGAQNISRQFGWWLDR